MPERATCRLSRSLRARPVSGPGVDTGQHVGQAALRALQITKPGPAAVTGGPAGASQPVTACIRSACRPSGRWSTIAARPRVESRGYPGQLEGNGPYLVALRAPGRAPGGPGTRPGLILVSTPSA